MNGIFDLLQGPFGQRATLALLHFIWQGLTIVLLLVVLRWGLGVRKAHTRYALSVFALLAMVACLPATFFLVSPKKSVPRVAETASPRQADVDQKVKHTTILDDRRYAGSLNLEDMRQSLDPVNSISIDSHLANSGGLPSKSSLTMIVSASQPYLLMLWGLGVMLLSFRLLLGMAGLRRLKAGGTPVAAGVAQRISHLAKRLGLTTIPPAFSSLRVAEAVAIGFFKPVILIPAAWLVEMTPDMLEAVIAHELVHIRRWDLWVNLFQRFVETLLFYHPAMWWLSHRIRLEREMCCDELAVSATGRRLTYVDALQEVVRRRVRATAPAAATVNAIGGTKMAILERVRNLLGGAPAEENIRFWPVGILTMLLPLLFWLSLAAGVAPLAAEDVGKAAKVAATDATTPAQPAQPANLEGQKKYDRISEIKFVGNQAIPESRLAKVIDYQRGQKIDRQIIDDGIYKLTSYYRGLGYFRVKIKPEIQDTGAHAKEIPLPEEDHAALILTIEEGIRFKIRHLALSGNKHFTQEELLKDLKFKGDQFFDQDELTADLKSLKDKYANADYPRAEIKPDPRFLEQDGFFDLHYEIDEDASHGKDDTSSIKIPKADAIDQTGDLFPPSSLDKQQPQEIWPLTLNDAVRCALLNSKVMRDIGMAVSAGSPTPSTSKLETAPSGEKPAVVLAGHEGQIVIARQNTDISLIDFEAAVRNLVSDVENVYWELYFAQRNLDAVMKGRDQALKTWHEVHDRLSDRALAGSFAEEAQAREQYYLFKSTCEQSLSTVAEIEKKLRYLLGVASSDGRLIRPNDEPATAKVTFDAAETQAEALRRNIEIRRQQLQIKRHELERNAAQEYANALGDKRNAGLRNAELALGKDRAILKEAELELSHVVATALRNVANDYALAYTNFDRRAAAEANLKAVEKAYDAGTIGIDTLLQTQRLQAQAESDYHRAVVNYVRSVAMVHYRKGSLLERMKVNLAEESQHKK